MGKIYLEPKRHVYINSETKEEFKSVTTILSLLEHKFQEEEISKAIELQSADKKKEKYLGLTQDEILYLWKEENSIANKYGTKIHNLLEEYLKSNKFYFPKEEEEKEILNAYDELNIDLGIRYHSERILFSEEFKIAGTSDHIVDIDTSLFDIHDFKTNKVINFYSQYNNKLLPPLEFLDDCQYNIYSIQLSIYAYLYEQETKRLCRKLQLLYFDRNSKKFIIYPVPYMKKEAIEVLRWFKDKRGSFV